MSDGNLLIEKRKAPRWKCSINVKFKVIDKEKLSSLKDYFSISKEGESRDISAGGALLITKIPLKIGDKLSLKIYPPATDSNIRAIGEVVRVEQKLDEGIKKYFIGVKYVDIITESDEVLEEILDQKLKQGGMTKLTKEEALKQARFEYFMRLINEERFNPK